jgi:LysM repeat protein
MALSVFDRGIDYAGFRPHAIGDPAAKGAKFIIRYSAGVGSSHAKTQWKLCGKDELRQLVHAGYDVIANSEWYESRVTEGPAAGAADGAADLAFWRERGLARGASIYVSWDEGQPNRHKHDKLAAYLTAYQRALDGRYHVDLYAGDVAIADMRARGLIRYGWRAMSDSWSDNGHYFKPGSDWRDHAAKVRQVSKAHLWQDGNRWFKGEADEDVILRLPVGSHREAAGTAPAVVGHPPTPPPATPQVHIVRSGETLSSIARGWHVSLTALERANPHAGHPPGNFDRILPGDRIVHP